MATLHVVFLVCAGAVFTASASIHPLRLNKRQSSNIDRCLVEFTEELCTSGYSQDQLDLAVKCNQSTASTLNSCSRNINGMLCGGIDTDAIRDSARSIGCDFSSTTCSPECRTRLMSIRDELDCCFSFFNDSSSGSFDPTLFDNRLWTSCGVQGSTQNCPSILVINEIAIDPTCNTSVFTNELFYTIYCRQEYIEPLMARVSAVPGCENYANEGNYVSCNTNRFGTHCDDIISETGVNFTIANQICDDTSTCDPLCIETLNNISITSGCCFNEDYNDTDTVRYDWLSYEFYSRCGLESPGLCPLGISIPNDETTPDDESAAKTTPADESATIGVGASSFALIISVLLTLIV